MHSISWRGPWRSFEAIEFATLTWVYWFNDRRRLQQIGNISPAQGFALIRWARRPRTGSATHVKQPPAMPARLDGTALHGVCWPEHSPGRRTVIAAGHGIRDAQWRAVDPRASRRFASTSRAPRSGIQRVEDAPIVDVRDDPVEQPVAPAPGERRLAVKRADGCSDDRRDRVIALRTAALGLRSSSLLMRSDPTARATTSVRWNRPRQNVGRPTAPPWAWTALG